ncbi:hypothetical protein JG688_00015694 [Phytophthora aleatoria]|uniref:Uncharacterized protein n=1 Tax=Phytophthora aleatoria TaxID=2496075 RepID=A0A8J5IV91_9STRA|nr:hypothetical protein JG688_00015694 [Phytophthora aleatoria]
MKDKFYKKVGAAYIVGRVCCTVKSKKKVRWNDSQFQSQSQDISLSLVQKGHANYSLLMATTTSPHWQDLCQASGDDRLAISDIIEELQEAPVHYNPSQVIPTSLAEVEAIKTMSFDPKAHMKQPDDIFTCGDGSTVTRLRDEYRHILNIRLSELFCISLFASGGKLRTRPTHTQVSTS